MKNTTKSKSKIKGNPTKRRSIKNSTIKEKKIKISDDTTKINEDKENIEYSGHLGPWIPI